MGPFAAPAGAHAVLENVRWETYEAMLRDRGNKPLPRFFYDRGTLEIIMPISGKHERLKCLLSRLIECFTLETCMAVHSAGSTTFKSQLRKQGLEPDESYSIENEALVRGKDDLDLSIDPPPDLAIEIDLTSTSVRKLAIYAGLGFPEVWSHDGAKVIVHSLLDTGRYGVVPRSKALPMLPLDDLNRFLDERHSLDETQLLRGFQAWVRERFGRG